MAHVGGCFFVQVRSSQLRSFRMDHPMLMNVLRRRREDTEACHDVMREIGERIAASLAKVLEMPSEVSSLPKRRPEDGIPEPYFVLFQSFTFQDSVLKMKAFGRTTAGTEAHDDSFLMKVVWQSPGDSSRIHVLNQSGHFVPVLCGPERLIVLFGRRLEA